MQCLFLLCLLFSGGVVLQMSMQDIVTMLISCDIRVCVYVGHPRQIVYSLGLLASSCVLILLV